MPRRSPQAPGETEGLVSREEFERKYAEYVRTHPFSKADVGRENPYTGRKIASQAEHGEYCREHVFRELCENNALRSARRRAVLALFIIVAALAFVTYSFFEVWYGDGYADGAQSAASVSVSPGPESPVPSPAPSPTSPPEAEDYIDPETTVYISRSGKIHIKPDCSGMESYDAMTYAEACAEGYERCKSCCG